MTKSIESRGTRSLGLIVIGALTVAVLGGMVLMHAAVPDTVMWDWHYGMWDDGHMAGWGLWGWGMMLFGLFWMALLIGLPIYSAYWLTSRSQTEKQTEDNALVVLREQYARGEIDDEEYERRRTLLESNR